MNSKQKRPTIVTVIALGLSAFFAPWDLTGSSNHTNITQFAPLFYPPELSVWSKRELASSILWLWLVMGVIYGALFVTFRQSQTNKP